MYIYIYIYQCSKLRVHPTPCVHTSYNMLIPLYKEEPMNKLPGARFWQPMHPECAQNKTLISNTDILYTYIYDDLLSTISDYIPKAKGRYFSSVSSLVLSPEMG